VNEAQDIKDLKRFFGSEIWSNELGNKFENEKTGRPEGHGKN
jgi:hypothetical protein